MSIKNLPIQIKKKGKTRGRPSKYELYISAIMSNIMEENKDVLKEHFKNIMVNGESAIEIDGVKFKKVKLRKE